MTVKMTANYAGELHCTVDHGPSGAQLETDAPKDNAGRGAAFSPTDLVGAALLSCAITTMAIVAARESIPFTTSSGTVEKHMSTDPPRRIVRLVARIELPASLSEAHRARLEAIARGCPVSRSLAEGLEADFTFTYA